VSACPFFTAFFAPSLGTHGPNFAASYEIGTENLIRWTALDWVAFFLPSSVAKETLPPAFPSELSAISATSHSAKNTSVLTVRCIAAQDPWVIVALPDLRRDRALRFGPCVLDALNDLAHGQLDKLVEAHAEILLLCVCPATANSLFLSVARRVP